MLCVYKRAILEHYVGYAFTVKCMDADKNDDDNDIDNYTVCYFGDNDADWNDDDDVDDVVEDIDDGDDIKDYSC